jgi:hypothetical protein
VIEYRNYAAAKAVYEQNPTATGALVELVKVIEFELVHEELQHRHGQ